MEPEATPLTAAPKCVWQLLTSSREQCRMLTCQDRPDGGIAAPWPSTAEPEERIPPRTCPVSADVGEAIVGTGASPAVIWMLKVCDALLGSVTRSCAV